MPILKKIVNRSEKMTKDANTSLKELKKIEALLSTSAGSHRMTRKRLKELNEAAVEESKIIVLKNFDVGLLLQLSRKIKKEARLREKSRRDDSESAVGKQLPAHNAELNLTMISDRDFTTPEFDTPVMEAMRKGILEEMKQSVTLRPSKTVLLKNAFGTPVSQNSSSGSNQLPHRVLRLRKGNTPHEEATSSNFLKQFDDLGTDDESEDDESEDENTGNAAQWTRYLKLFGRAEKHIDKDLIDGLFCSNQVFDFDPHELFPETDKKKLQRRRSSLWDDDS